MSFDKLADIAERQLPQLKRSVASARVFLFESRPTVDSVQCSLEDWKPDERCIQNFRLPFPCIAIVGQDRDDCIIMRTIGDPGERTFEFINCRDSRVCLGQFVALPGASSLHDGDYTHVAQIRSMAAWDARKGCKPMALDEVALGIRSAVLRFSGPQLTSSIGESDFVFHNRLANDLAEDITRHYSRIIKLTVCRAVFRVLVINDPSRFIVEDHDAVPKLHSGKNVQRFSRRPKYIVLTPREIRKRLLIQEPTDESGEKSQRTPHERRGHFRRLQSERYTKAKGSVIWIKSMWIGPSEAVVGKRRYKVIFPDPPS